MAKITIAGQAIVVTSSLKLDDIKMVQKYRPKALVVYGGEDGKDELFAIGAGDSERLTDFGICFAAETRDEKLATITMMTGYNGDNIKEYVADRLCTAISQLNKMEDALPAVIEEIAAERNRIMNDINVIG